MLAAPDNILSDPDTAMWGPIVANVWYGIPFFAITLLAALQSIPNELYEAASIDGASEAQQFRSHHAAVPRADHRHHADAAHRVDRQFRRPDRRDDEWRAGQFDADRRELHLHPGVPPPRFRLCLGDRRRCCSLLLLLYSLAIIAHSPLAAEGVAGWSERIGPAWLTSHPLRSTRLRRRAAHGRDRPLALALGFGHPLRRSSLAFILFALFPLFWLLKVSVTPTSLLYTEGIRMWPSETTWENYGIRADAERVPALLHEQPDRLRARPPSIVTIVAAAAGYAFSRFGFRGKIVIVALMLITQMFPLVMLIAPIFKMLSPLGLTNSLTGLIIVYSAFNVPFATFLMQSFFDGVPRDLEEAAMIDGDTRFGAFRKIVLPLTLPGIGATLGFVFTAAWSELLFALMLISKADKQTFPVGLLSFVGKFSVDFGQMMAAGVLALIPACLFFVFIQRYLVQGLTAGAVKG